MKKLLIIGNVWPEPNSTAAGQRMLQLVDFFLNQKYSITFASTATTSEYSYDFDLHQIKSISIVLNDASFDDFILQENPNIVLFDRFITEEQFGWRIEKNCPNTIRILDSEDLHFLREARAKAYKKKEKLLLSNGLYRRYISWLLFVKYGGFKGFFL